MSQAENPYATWGMTAAEAPTNERTSFIRQTYLHLGGAVLAFVALEALLLQLPGIENLVALMSGNQLSWLLVLGAFVGVSYIADSWAKNTTSISMQYLGLGLFVVAEAVIFVPLMWFASEFGGKGVLPTAGLLTAIVFCGLTAIVFITGADFSFLRTGLYVATFIALGLIVLSAIIGFNLGIIFIGAMLAVASGYILYDTSNVLHHYRIGQHVAAALALFASVALLFWYMVQLVLSLTGRD